MSTPAQPPEAPKGPIYITVTLETPIVRGDQTITSLTLRKPRSGELRGTSMIDIANQDYLTLEKILPRITNPVLTTADVAALDPADLFALGTEVSGFLLGTTKRASLGL